MDYGNGKIYIIRNTKNNKVYIGSTTQSLSKRMAKHRSTSKQKRCENIRLYQAFKTIGIENFYIELIMEYPCINKEQLCKEEGKYIREHNSFDKEYGYNMVINCRKRKEYEQSQQRKTRRKEREQTKKYKDKLKEYCQLTEQCLCCGHDINKHGRATHFKTQKHKEHEEYFKDEYLKYWDE